MRMKLVVGLLAVLFLPTFAVAQTPERVQKAEPDMEDLLPMSPENTVRLLVKSIYGGDLKRAAGFVLYARPDTTLPTEFTEIAKSVDWSIENVRSIQDEDQAVVSFNLRLKRKDDPAEADFPNNLLLLKVSRDTWKVMPASPNALYDLEENGNFILFVATFLVHPEGEKGWRERTADNSILSKLAQISYSARLFAHDHDFKLALDAKTYTEQLLPYTKTDEVFYLPAIEPRQKYSFNQNLENVELYRLFENGASVVLFYTGQNEQLDFLYRDRAAVAFANGNTKLVSREEAKQLRWKP